MDTLDEITLKIKLDILQILDYQLLLTTKMVEELLSKANSEELLGKESLFQQLLGDVIKLLEPGN